MKIVAVAGQKGGSTRTTLATSLAVIAEMVGIRALVLDLDPQASASVWRDARAAEYPDVVAAQHPRLPRILENARQGGVGLVLLDCPPNAETTTLAACEAAHFAIIPMRPSARDVAAMRATVKLLREVTKTKHVVVLSACPSNTSVITNEIEEALGAAQVPVCPVRIYNRVAHYSHANSGLTATECDPKGKAAAELEALWQWLCTEIGLQSSNLSS